MAKQTKSHTLHVLTGESNRVVAILPNSCANSANSANTKANSPPAIA